MKKVSLFLIIMYLLPILVRAHSFARYVSTPLTPPREFVWWFPVCFALIAAGAFLIIWRIFKRRWLVAILLAVLATSSFAILFFMFGRFAASMSTAPPPGLGFPFPTFWGMGWKRVGWLFFRWNLYGYLFLLTTMFLCCGIHRSKKRFPTLVLATLGLYIIGLIPYIVTGALVHGWAGGYVHRRCDQRLEVLNSALAKYADRHGGCLPNANNIDLLLEKVKPYLDQDRARYLVPIAVCPLGGAYEQKPKKYKWNTVFSGKKLRDIDPDCFYQNVVPISCPYHRIIGIRASFELVERICEAKRKRNTTKSANRTE